MRILRRSRSEDADENAREAGVYRLEVDNESRHFRDGVTFSFWSSAKIIFLLAILLWWLPQSAGYMVAGYVGGRRAGSPWKAIAASLIPVAIIFAVSATYAAGYGQPQISYIAALPASIALSLGDAIPFVAPYSQFVAEYLTTFVLALQQLFGMGSNGYLVTIAFAYIGGIVADQARRELEAKKEGTTTAVNIIQPGGSIAHAAHLDGRAVVRARPERPGLVVYRARHAKPVAYTALRKLPAEVVVARRPMPRRSPPRDEETRLAPAPTGPAASPHGNRDSSMATQRYVERALRAYERHRHEHRRT